MTYLLSILFVWILKAAALFTNVYNIMWLVRSALAENISHIFANSRHLHNQGITMCFWKWLKLTLFVSLCICMFVLPQTAGCAAFVQLRQLQMDNSSFLSLTVVLLGLLGPCLTRLTPRVSFPMGEFKRVVLIYNYKISIQRISSLNKIFRMRCYFNQQKFFLLEQEKLLVFQEKKKLLVFFFNSWFFPHAKCHSCKSFLVGKPWSLKAEEACTYYSTILFFFLTKFCVI